MTGRPRRRAPVPTVARAAVLAAGAALLLLGGAPSAQAHPLGNFTVNHYDGFTLFPDRIDVTAVVDRAEIAAAQELPAVDADADGRASTAERKTYARRQCDELARKVTARVDGERVHWRVRTSAFTRHPGQAGLRTSRLHCGLTGPADLSSPARVEVTDSFAGTSVGWHEMTAEGSGVRLSSSPLPTSSATDELRHYPADLLADPLDQRSATLRTEPGAGDGAPALPAELPGAGPLTAALTRVTGLFDSLVGADTLTLPVGLLALALSLVLGASHAAMPGHGKTIMAAYLAGRRGSVRDAVTVGATVTFTHTAGVLVLGFALPLTTRLAGESVLGWLGVASGLLVTGIGLALLKGALRSSGDGIGHFHGHSHGHGHSHSHSHSHGHGHGHSHGHSHGQHAPGHPHPGQPYADRTSHGGVAVLAPAAEATEPRAEAGARPGAAPRPARAHARRGLIGVGIAGGLVPSPSALVVLLGAVALGRTAFGVLLVLGYGLGMALTLTAAGVALVKFRDALTGSQRLSRLASSRVVTRLGRRGPALTAGLVVAVGLGLTARAFFGSL
ncbi:nickel transporter [Streptomyces qinglanensis]|uniref:ABC-type nickel/cobalt efflux system, permease component RcnA n=1 Tax=Streptomyces qinglanensis TaxID=943816 RepID=A0A1H9WAN1_9ACTN|nr:nickel transporter [Streptomyces qinglanensis]SES30895.1 ABC-type nickel/cobalt efflux system, permease component RcnA [Streptomyces qinglanensis]